VELEKLPKSHFYDDIGREGVALVDFNAIGSAPCIRQLPIIEQLSKQYHDKVTVIIIDVDNNKELATSFRITSIPTLIVLKNGREAKRFVGLQSIKTLTDALENMMK
jgi:thioredoxin 1